MNLYYAIITSIWVAVLYAIWAATEAGDPGYGQIAFLIGGLVATWYIRKRKLERPRIDDKEIVIPEEKFFYDDADLNSKALWILQVKSFQKIEEAILFTESLKRMRLNPYIVKKTISDTKIYRVRVYSTEESDNLQNAIKKLEKKGYKLSIIKE